MTLPVADLKKSRDFYVDTLKLTTKTDENDQCAILFLSDNSFLMLLPKAEFDKALGTKTADTPSNHIHPTFFVYSKEQIDELYSTIKTSNPDQPAPAQDAYGAYVLKVNDPDGNLVTINYNGHFPPPEKE